MKRLLLTLVTLLSTQFAYAQEWLAHSPVSFYETRADWRLVEASFGNPIYNLANDSLGEPFDGAPERPYGFGRELDDQSPADFDGLTRDTAYFFGYQFIIVGILYVLPESVSAWTDEQKEEYTFEKWKHNVTHPRWDPDEWYINYILHPYWGLTYYTRGRERGLTEMGSFWYSVALSSIYEFGLEALFEPVSIQDVIFTPTLGSLLGWYVEDYRRDIKSQSEFSGWDKTVLIATDPLGSLNTIVDGWFGVGVESEMAFRSFYRSPAITEWERQSLDDPYESRQNPVVADYLGVELTLHWH
ncbi:MAG: DUF3943 domain-containing protein [Candidatus Thiodiazotropha sp.]